MRFSKRGNQIYYKNVSKKFRNSVEFRDFLARCESTGAALGGYDASRVVSAWAWAS